MNDKLILRALNFLLLKSQTFSEKEVLEKMEILEEIEKELNPKEEVPYEESLKEETKSSLMVKMHKKLDEDFEKKLKERGS